MNVSLETRYVDRLIELHRNCKEQEFFWNSERLFCASQVFNPQLAESSFLLADAVLRMPLSGLRVLDVGCGCGLQTVSALLAGAAEVVAFDVAFRAVRNTLANAQRVGLAHRVRAFCGDSMPRMGRIDVVILNPPFFNEEVQEAWLRAFFDTDRALLREVGRACSMNWPGGKLICAIGGDLRLETLKEHLDRQWPFDWSLVNRARGQVGARVYLGDRLGYVTNPDKSECLVVNA